MAPPEPLDFAADLQAQLEPYMPPAECAAREGWRPFVTLTYATSLDSQIAFVPGVQTVISGQETKAMTHYLRYRHDSIAVGAGTWRADDPTLNCRLREALSKGVSSQPRPVLLDRQGLTVVHAESRAIKAAASGYGKMPLVCVGPAAKEMWLSNNAERGSPAIDMETVESFEDALTALKHHRLHSVMIEGGASVINEILSSHIQLVDSVIVTIAPVYFGQGGASVRPPRSASGSEDAIARLSQVKWISMGNDVVLCGKVKPDGRLSS